MCIGIFHVTKQVFSHTLSLVIELSIIAPNERRLNYFFKEGIHMELSIPPQHTILVVRLNGDEVAIRMRWLSVTSRKCCDSEWVR